MMDVVQFSPDHRKQLVIAVGDGVAGPLVSRCAGRNQASERVGGTSL